jgi:hypothetical protein
MVLCAAKDKLFASVENQTGGKLWACRQLSVERLRSIPSRRCGRPMDRLAIELVQRADTPAAILIKWPPQPTVTDPAKLTATIAAIVRVLGKAQIELAARRTAGL